MIYHTLLHDRENSDVIQLQKSVDFVICISDNVITHVKILMNKD